MSDLIELNEVIDEVMDIRLPIQKMFRRRSKAPVQSLKKLVSQDKISSS